MNKPFSRDKHKDKSLLEVIESKYGKEPSVTSSSEIKAFLGKKGYKSLSKLIEA